MLPAEDSLGPGSHCSAGAPRERVLCLQSPSCLHPGIKRLWVMEGSTGFYQLYLLSYISLH